jgi:hypothetical protein
MKNRRWAGKPSGPVQREGEPKPIGSPYPYRHAHLKANVVGPTFRACPESSEGAAYAGLKPDATSCRPYAGRARSNTLMIVNRVVLRRQCLRRTSREQQSELHML